MKQKFIVGILAMSTIFCSACSVDKNTLSVDEVADNSSSNATFVDTAAPLDTVDVLSFPFEANWETCHINKEHFFPDDEDQELCKIYDMYANNIYCATLLLVDSALGNEIRVYYNSNRSAAVMKAAPGGFYVIPERWYEYDDPYTLARADMHITQDFVPLTDIELMEDEERNIDDKYLLMRFDMPAGYHDLSKSTICMITLGGDNTAIDVSMSENIFVDRDSINGCFIDTRAYPEDEHSWGFGITKGDLLISGYVETGESYLRDSKGLSDEEIELIVSKIASGNDSLPEDMYIESIYTVLTDRQLNHEYDAVCSRDMSTKSEVFVARKALKEGDDTLIISAVACPGFSFTVDKYEKIYCGSLRTYDAGDLEELRLYGTTNYSNSNDSLEIIIPYKGKTAISFPAGTCASFVYDLVVDFSGIDMPIPHGDVIINGQLLSNEALQEELTLNPGEVIRCTAKYVNGDYDSNDQVSGISGRSVRLDIYAPM